MSYRWQIEEGTAESRGAEDHRATPAAGGAERRLAPDGGSGFRIARRRLLAVAGITLALVALAVAGWRYWKGRELLEQIRSDVRAAVELEERALVEGDTELYLRQQSRSRERLVNRQLGRGDDRMARKPPLPGLRAGDAPAVIQSIEPETDTPRGQPIRRATVNVLTQHADALGQATFVESRPFVLSNRGRWIHSTHPEEIAEAEPERWNGRWLDVRYLPADAETLPPILERVEAHLARFCAVAEGCEQSLTNGGSRTNRVRLDLLGDVQGRGGRDRVEAGHTRLLPAPSLTLQPANRRAEELYARHVLRLALLDILEQRSGDGFRFIDGFARPVGGLNDHQILIGVLIDAWLALEMGLEPAQPQVWPAASYTLLLPGLWHQPAEGPYSDGDWQAVLRHFAAYLADHLEADQIARLILSLPNSRDAATWLEASLGARASDLLANWQITGPVFPAARDLLVACWFGNQEQLLFQPGRSAPRVLRQEYCGVQSALDAVWHPSGDILALSCGGLPSRPEQIRSGPEATIHRVPVGDEAVASDLAVPAGGEAIWPRSPHWTADGGWLLWSTLAEDRDARIWAMPADEQAWHRGDEARLFVGRSRWIEAGPEDPQISAAQRDPLRPSPVASIVAFEAPEGRVAVVELNEAGPVQRWSTIGSDPVWSPDGASLSVLRFDPNDAMGRVELVLLDASDGRELARSTLDLAGLAAEAAQSFRGPSPAAVAERWKVRLRVGAWSSDSGHASLVAATRIERSTPATGRWPSDGVHDWLSVLTLDVASGEALQARLPAEVYIDARTNITRWLPGDRRLVFLHVEPEMLPLYLDRDPPPDGSIEPLPVASLLDLDSGQMQALDPAALAVRWGPEAMDVVSTSEGRPGSSNARGWHVRMGRLATREQRWGGVQLEIWATGDDEPRWSLPATYCRSLAWRPEPGLSATRPAAGR